MVGVDVLLCGLVCFVVVCVAVGVVLCCVMLIREFVCVVCGAVLWCVFRCVAL